MAITTKTRKQLKSYFVKNAIPTEGNFSDLIDAQLNQAEDGVFKLPNEPLGVVAAAEAQKPVLRFYSPGVANPEWQLSLNPQQNPADPASARSGLGVVDGAGRARFFIDAASGSVGIGTNAPNPKDRLTVSGGDVRIEGGFHRRLKIISDEYWSGIELVARQQGEKGTDAHPHIDFTHGELDEPNYGIRMWAFDNSTLRIQAGTGTFGLQVKGNAEMDGALKVGSTVTVNGRLTVENRDVLTEIQNAAPVGAIYMHAGGKVPEGYLPCDGRAVSREEFSRLFAVIGTAWGAGDGSTTFNLPDLRGRAPIGAGAGPGLTERVVAQKLGVEKHVLAKAELPAHTHRGTTSEAADHAHSGTTAAGGAHGHTGSANPSGSHAHSGTTGGGNPMYYRIVDSGNGNNNNSAANHVTGWEGGGYRDANDAGYSLASHTHNFGTSTEPNHQHSLSISNDPGHSHNFSTAAAGRHAHNVTTDAGDGEGKAHENMMPCAVINYIIRW